MKVVKNKKEQIDFMDESSFNNILNTVIKDKTGKKIKLPKIPIKVLVAIVVYLAGSGLVANVIWIVKLIKMIF